MNNLTRNKQVLLQNPYLIIAVAAILAYLPVSTMALALKNDVIAIEFPIQFFLSESLRNLESPVWFNTWAMGFPLQSVLSWSFFSTPQTMISLLLGSSVYALHFEFIMYIMASGWCMYWLLKKHFINDSNFALVLSCCYMLSGFTVASSQWLLYITGMTFIPLLAGSMLSLLKKPALTNSILFAVFYYLLFTNVHIYITILVDYILFFFLLYFIVKKSVTGEKENRKERINLFKFIGLACLFTAILCAVPVYYTLELMGYLNRNNPLGENATFFQSNYLHPKALTSLLLPLPSVRAAFSNTEGVLLNVYIGLIPLILFPASLVLIRKQKNTRAIVLLVLAAFFLVISFGHITPFRQGLNILPGLSYFRNAGVLRVFFIFFFILYLSLAYQNFSFQDIINRKDPAGRIILFVAGLILGILLLIFIMNISAAPGFFKDSVYQTLKEANQKDLVFINSLTQTGFAFLLLWALLKKKKWIIFPVIAELIVNTLICTPYYTTGTYSVKEVNDLLQTPAGFPVQQALPGEVVSSYKDKRGNTWYNINTFQKKVSNQVSMTGPLILGEVNRFLEQPELQHSLLFKKLVFFSDSVIQDADTIHILQQKPNKVEVLVKLTGAREITLQQSYFPGWKAYYNNKEIRLSEKGKPFVSAKLPGGNGTLSFIFKKTGMIVLAILLHLIIIITLSIYLFKKRELPISPHPESIFVNKKAASMTEQPFFLKNYFIIASGTSSHTLC